MTPETPAPQTPAPQESAPTAPPPPVPPSYPFRSGGAGRGIPATEVAPTPSTQTGAPPTAAGEHARATADVPETQFGEFHDQLFANQPPSVGAGWTDELLSQFAKDAGIAGAQHQTWQKCVDDGKFADYVASVEAGAVKAGITADPAILRGGQPFTIAGLDAASFAKAVTGK